MQSLPLVCCSPLLAEPLSVQDSVRLAELLRVLADPVRLRLVSLVAAAPAGEVCACDLVDVLERSQPTISHHLKVLWQAGILKRERRGTWIHYRIVPGTIAPLTQLFAPSS